MIIKNELFELKHYNRSSFSSWHYFNSGLNYIFINNYYYYSESYARGRIITHFFGIKLLVHYE